MKCARCHKDRITSSVSTQQYKVGPCLKEDYFRDEHSRLHAHHGNADYDIPYLCSQGHTWTRRVTIPCWCGWSKYLVDNIPFVRIFYEVGFGAGEDNFILMNGKVYKVHLDVRLVTHKWPELDDILLEYESPFCSLMMGSGAVVDGIAWAREITKTVGLPKRLDLVNPASGERFEMVLKENGPVEGTLEVDREHNPQMFEHMVMCRKGDSVALTGILVDAGTDVKIDVSIDGEYILKDAPPADVSAFVPRKRQRQTDLFSAETPDRAHTGLFLLNGTRVCVFASAPGSIRVMVRLQTALYTSIQRAPKVCETHESDR